MLALPCAKINIGLNIVNRRADGYHDLETVFYPVPLTDVLEIKTLSDGSDTEMQIIGMPAGEDERKNLVYRVYDDLRREFSLPAISIYLCKKIPTGAGMGGGSSDAAEMMKMLNKMFELGLSNSDMESRLSHYGADCAFFVKGKAVYAEGIGNVFSDVSVNLENKFMVIVKPPISVNTREAYSGITAKTADYDLKKAVAQDISSWRGVIKNDFEAPVFKLHPEIGAIKQTLYDMGAVYSAMSGSGSAVFGLFDRPIDNLNKIFSDCFTFEKQLRR